MKTFIDKRKYLIVFIGIFLIYIFNLFIDVMDIDAAQYASISMEMSQSDNYLHVYHRGNDYLDKPPLLFWTSALSMKLFGINNFAYKFPSFLFALLGIFSTYKFAQLYYKKETAQIAAMILASTQALFLITNDVRTDTSLLSFVIFAVWQLVLFVRTNKWKYLVLGFGGVALAMMAKGPIGLVAVAAALGTDFLLKKEWKLIFNWKWIVGLLILALFLLPMSYGLYTQFDLHPEKTAYGIQSPSGIEFFYWTQSFGRITGESSWSNNPGFFFFFHSILWDFQPWILLLVPGLFSRLFSLIRRKKAIESEFEPEYVSLGGFILIFLALSFSQYKLPHYIFVTFPFAAIISANFLMKLSKGIKGLFYSQAFLNLLFWVVILLGCIFFFPPSTIILPIILGLLFFGWLLILIKTKGYQQKFFFGTCVTAIAFNLLLATNFYPQLIGNYQGSSNIGKNISKTENANLHFYLSHEHTLDFYSKRIVPDVNTLELPHLQKGSFVYTNQVGMDSIKLLGLPYKVIKTSPDFPVTQLTIPFLNKESRPETLDTVYLLERK